MTHPSRFTGVLAVVNSLVLILLVAAADAPPPSWEERPPAGPGLGPLPATSVWLRAWVRVPDNMAGMSGPDLWRDSMTFTLEDLPGPAKVFLNGRPIIETQDIPAGAPRRFKVPRGSFEKSAYNAVVIQLDGAKAPEGLRVPPILAGYFDELKMNRAWQLTTRKPDAHELRASPTEPGVAVYREADFQPGTSPLQPRTEPIRGRYVSPEEALAKLEPGGDLMVEELLHEPVVAQPTHVSFDARGRLWVAQYRQYPYPAGVKMISRDKFYRSKYDRVPPPPPQHDRGADIISVHEDQDGDGRYESHKTVLSGLNMANAVVSGHGGLWVMHTPYLLFYPDRDGDDMPDGPPEVRLAGFGLEDTHSIANGLAWGPDGWLYGAQGSTTTSRVTRPGLDPADAPGVYVEGCMVWRYHPERHLYEIFADGSGNTFGISFDEEGRLFTGHNGGDTRGWHHIQEGIYLKQGHDPGKFGPPANPFAFGELPMMRSTHAIPRFTHMTIVAAGTALPAPWRGKFVGVDPLHHCLVGAAREPAGSTFQTTDIGYLLRSDDLTFRPVYLANAPDGSLIVADFREEFIAHGQNYQSQIDPDTGRIYRVRGRQARLEQDVDLSRQTTLELVGLLRHSNLWHRQTAVRLLGERGDPAALPELKRALATPDTHPALEALWALHQMDQLDDELATTLLDHPAAPVRAWTTRLLGDARTLPARFASRLVELAGIEPDAEVRCQIMSTARRLPADQALPLVRVIASRVEDVDDPFIPLMAWFVVESHCAAQRDAVLDLFSDSPFWSAPLVRRHLVPRLMRRFAQSGTRQELLACARLVGQAPSDIDRAALIEGFEAAFQGRAVPSLPEELLRALAKSGRMTLLFRVRQGDPLAVGEALRQIANEDASVEERLSAIRVFGEVKHPAAVPVLLEVVLRDGLVDLRGAACAALVLYEDPLIGEKLAGAWPALPDAARSAVLNLLGTRGSWSLALMEAVAEGRIPRTALPPDLPDRLRLHKDHRLAALLGEQFPDPAPAREVGSRERIQAIGRILAAAPGNAYRGEPIYTSLCGGCHTLFFKGGKVGPDLTSYQRDDLSTMLTSIVDPDAEIREGYENHIVVTGDGRTLSGFIADQDLHVVVLRGFDGADISLRRSDIMSIEAAGRSIMPGTLLDGLSETEIRDLFAYLRQSQPIVK